jgi:pyrroline-5-carboxylate reductase
MTTIGFVGAGNMGEALIRGLVGGKVVRPADLWISEPDAARRARLVKGYRVRAAPTTPTSLLRGDRLAVKPQLIAAVLAAIAPAPPPKLVI